MEIPISSLEFTRGDIDEKELADLVDSIREQGLLHPITVRIVDGKNELISGKKRVVAAQVLQWTNIEALVVQASDNDVKVIKVHENLHRHNLPWYEQVVLIKELHDLRQSEHGIAERGRPARGTEKSGWGIRDTAKELGLALGPLAEDLMLAREVESNKSLRNVKDKKTAVRLVRQQAKRALAELEQAAPPDIEVNQVYLGSSEAILKQFPSYTFDACITDPPWISFYKEELTHDQETHPVFPEIFRVLKPDAFLYLFCGHEDYYVYEKLLPKFGFRVSKTPVLWVKENALSRRGVAGWEYDRDYEFILLAVKGSPVLTETGKRTSIKTFPAVPPVKLIHPNEKPKALIGELVDDCTYRGAVILDPFGGSGVLAEAATRIGRNYVIIERDKTSYDKIVRRMERVEAEITTTEDTTDVQADQG